MMNPKPLILVVDDELDTRTFLYSLLYSEGYDVATCTHALEAMKYVSHAKPDVVLTDFRMPDIDGLELLSKIKYMSPRTRVIVLTAYGDERMYFDTLDRGGHDMILKPYRNDELLRAVARTLEEAAP